MKGTGLGLTSMNERLRLVGGELSIQSGLNKGIRVHARVPIAQQRTPQVGSKGTCKDFGGLSVSRCARRPFLGLFRTVKDECTRVAHPRPPLSGLLWDSGHVGPDKVFFSPDRKSFLPHRFSTTLLELDGSSQRNCWHLSKMTAAAIVLRNSIDRLAINKERHGS